MAAGLFRYFRQSSRSIASGSPEHDASEPETADVYPKDAPIPGSNRRILLLVFLIIIAAGFYLRVSGLDTRSISHPEVYVPGIELPAGISEPPSRTSLVPLLFFHFYAEPHPPAYYFFMFGWTKLFGTSLLSLRMPSVLFGLMSILLLAMIARTIFDNTVALISAALLAFNGHHIYWSQHARMYSMVCFLGLLSVWLLLKCLQEHRVPSLAGWAFAYVLVACLGIYTELVFWPLLGGQVLFVWLRQSGSPATPADRMSSSRFILYCQSLVIMTGAPMWAHAVMTGRQSPLEPLSMDFISELLSFGFLFERDIFSFPTREIPAVLLVTLALVSVLCILASFVIGPNRGRFERSVATRWVDIQTPPDLVSRCIVAFFSLTAIIGVSLASDDRRGMILATGLLPILALVAPAVLNRASTFIRDRTVFENLAKRLTDGRGLLLCLFFIPVGLILTVSIFNSLLASRVFLIFTPYLMVLIGLGVIGLARSKIVAAGLIVLLSAAHLGSIYFYAGYPSEAFDYKEVATLLNATAREGDSMLVHNTSWVTTPLYYHLDLDRFNIVADDLLTATNRSDVTRVWLVNFEGQSPTEEMVQALSAFHPTASISSQRADVVLYQRIERP